ncbi:hypothetical protein [Solicola sp. PLA-1-18]|uniref:hypothetical protein n=1 Tax=Solicola sp. PLA-1-18 TaxID=3380532 RepID=UPI003B7D0038
MQRADIWPWGSQEPTVEGRGADVSADLNLVCAEGWDLVTGSVTFVPTGEQSQDNFFAGSSVSVSGRLVGHYLFRRLAT